MCFHNLHWPKPLNSKPHLVPETWNLRLVNSYVYNLWWKPWTQHVKNIPCPCKLEGCVFTTCTTQNPWTQPTSCAQNLEFVLHNLRLLNSYVYNLWWKPWTQHMKKDRIIHRWLHNFWPKPWTQHMKKDSIIHRWLHNFWPKPWTQHMKKDCIIHRWLHNFWPKPWTQHMKKDCIIHRWLHNFWPKPWTQPHNSHSWIIYPRANYTMVLLMTLVATLFH